MTDVNANIIVNIDSSAALVNLRRLETQIDQFQRRASASGTAAAASQHALNKALLDGINNTGLFSAKTVMAQDSMSKLSQSIDQGKLSLGEYTRYASSQLPGLSRVFRREFDLMGQVAESRVKKMQTQYIALGKTVDGVTRTIASTPTGLAKGYATDVALATQRQQLFNRMIDDGSTKLLNWGKNTQWAGRQLMVGFSIPMVALGAAAAKTFMEIDKATVSLKRVYGDLGTTTQELDRNVEAVKVLGKEYTKYGIAVSETVNISARAAATGATNEKLMAATEQTLRFATLGQMDYNQALDTTISLQTAFGTSNEDLGKKIDYLNAVENQTVLTMEDMSLAIPRVATVVKGLGGDVEDLAVMMTAMKEGGISAENAANGLKSGLASLINPTKRAKESMADLGINMNGIINANRGDLMGLVTDFGSAINSLDQFSRQQVLEKVFGKFQFARMSALFSNITNDAGQAARAMDIAKMSTQELAKMSEKELGKISESTSVKFQAAMENLKNSVAPIGEAFLKGLTPVINVVSKIADAFNNLPGGIKNTIAVITALLAGIAPVALMGIGLLANGFANLVKTVQFFRKTIARIKGDGDAFKWLVSGELQAVSATEALEGSAQSLTGKLLLQKGAVEALTNEYARFAQVAGIANGAMGRMGGGKARGAGSTQRPPLKMATGGMVPGTGNKDTIPALLTPGESVITKKATQKYAPILHQMNNGTLPGFNNGVLGLIKAATGRGASQSFRSNLMKNKGESELVKSLSGKEYRDAVLNQETTRRISERRSGRGGFQRSYWNDKGFQNQFFNSADVSHTQKLRSSVRGSDQKYFSEKTSFMAPAIENRGLENVFGSKAAQSFWKNDVAPTLNKKNQELLSSVLAGKHPTSRAEIEGMMSILESGESLAKIKGIKNRWFTNGWDIVLSSAFAERLNTSSAFGKASALQRKRGFSTYSQKEIDKAIKSNSFAMGGVSIGQALKSWQTSSKSVRENPQMLAALTPGYEKLKSGMRLNRGTTLGLGSGSEFSKKDEALIFNALKTGDYESIIGREFSVSGPLSYSQTMEGTMGALTSNTDVRRIEFLKAQHALGRRKNAEDLLAIKRLEASIAKGTGPVDLYTRQLAERKARVAMYPEGQKTLGREIKALAPKGYQRVQMEQQFYGGGENSLLDVNRQNQLAAQEGTFMGKNVSREQEFIAPPSKIRVSGVEVDQKTGIPKLITSTVDTIVPGSRTPYGARKPMMLAGGAVGLGMKMKQSMSAASNARSAAQSERVSQLDLIHGAGTSGIKNFRQQDTSGHFISGIYALQNGSKRGTEAYQYAINNAMEHGGANAQASAYTFKYANKKNPGKGPRVFDWESKLTSNHISEIEKLAKQNGLDIPPLNTNMSVKDAFNVINAAVVPQSMFGGVAGEKLSKLTNVFEKSLKLNKYDMIKNYTKLGDSEAQAILRGKHWVPQEIKDTSKIEGWTKKYSAADDTYVGLNSGGVMLGSGMVPGVGNTDKIPALLTPGESVITKKATKKYAPVLHQMNKGTLPGFNEGGVQSQRRGSTVHMASEQEIARMLSSNDSKTRAHGRRLEAQRRRALRGSAMPGPVERAHTSGVIDKNNPASWTPDKYSMQTRAANQMSNILDPNISAKNNAAFVDETKAYFEDEKSRVDKEVKDKKKADRMKANLDKKRDKMLTKINNNLGLNANEFQTQSKILGRITTKIAAGTGPSVSPKFVKFANAVQAEAKSYLAPSRPGLPGYSPLPAAGVSKPANIPTPAASASSATARELTRREQALQRKAQAAAGTSGGAGRFVASQGGIRDINKPLMLGVGPEGRAQMEAAAKTEARAAINASRARAKAAVRSERLALRGMSVEQATKLQEEKAVRARARQFLNEARQSGQTQSRAKQVRGGAFEREAKPSKAMEKVRGFGAKAMGAGFMLSMLPAMAADRETGKFMGMDAGMATMGLMAGSMAPSMIGGIGKGVGRLALGAGKMAGGAGLVTGAGGALTASAGLVAATGGAALGLAAIGVTAWALKKGMDNTLEAGLRYADALTVSTKEQEDIAKLFGRTTLQERRLQKERSKSLNLTTQEQKMGAEFAATDPGKAMVEQAKLLESKGANVASIIGTQLSRMIVSGAINKKQAKAIAAGLADELGKPEMAVPISLKVARIVGPDGKDLTKNPTKIIDNLQKEFSAQESSLASSLQTSQNTFSNDWASGIAGGLFGLSGAYDQLIENQIAYTNTVIENGNQIVGAIDDEIARQQILIDKLKEKKETEKGEDAKKTQKEIDAANKRQKDLEDRKKREDDAARQRGAQALLGVGSTGRAERFTAMAKDVEASSGVGDIQDKIYNLLNKSGSVIGDRTSQNGKYLSTQGRDKFMAELLVDVKMGKIDANALAAFDAMSGSVRGKVIPIAMSLYQKGDLEGFSNLSNIGSLAPEVQDLFTKLEVTDEQAATVAKTLYDLTDAASQTKFLKEVMDSGADGLKNFTEQAAKLQDLNIDVASIFSNNGIKGVALASLAVEKITLAMKGFKEEIDSISKQKTVSGKIAKTVEVVTQIATKAGIKTNPKAVRSEIDQLSEETGLSKKKIVNLPADVLVKTLELRLQADSYRSLGKTMMNKGAASLLTPGDPANGKGLIAQGQLLVGLADELDLGASSTASSTSAASGGGTTPPPGPTGGSGSKTNYVKDMMKGFLDQAKMYANAGITMKQLTDSKYKFAKDLLAGGKANKGIIGQLRSIGLSENIIAELLSKGPEAATQALKTYKKGGKAAVNKANIADFSGTMSGLIGETRERIGLQNRRTNATNILKTRFNASPEIIETALQDDRFTNILDDQNLSRKQRNAEITKYIQLLKAERAAQQQTNLVTDAASTLQESFGKYSAAVDAGFAAEQWKVRVAAAQEFAQKNNMTVEAMERQIVKNERLIKQQQDLIDTKQESINQYQRTNDLAQQGIDDMQRQDELRTRVADALSHELELMSKKEQDINDAYQKRVSALDKIASINQHILDQQSQQVNFAQALSTGDVGAAVQAQQQMQNSSAQYATDQMRAGLQAGMENQIAGLTTGGGLTRKQAEDQISAIKEQSYQTSLKIRDESDKIYNNNLLIRNLNNEIYDIQNGQMKNLQKQNDSFTSILSNYQTELDYSVSMAKFAGMTSVEWEASKQSVDAMIAKMNSMDMEKLKGDWKQILADARAYNALPSGFNPDESGTGFTPATGFAAMSGAEIKNLTGSDIGEYLKWSGGGMGLAFAAGGFVPKKYATGGNVGMDSVPAMLTPGEFVMRKASVDKYGKSMLSSMNMGAFSMPKYNVGNMSTPEVTITPITNSTNVSAPVYNTYSVNVNVPNSNASADDIANKVMMKIRNTNNMAVRGINGY